MCRVRLRGEGLASLHYESGQDGGWSTSHRHGPELPAPLQHPVLDPTEEVLTLDICLHGDGPGARWAAGAVPGSTVEIHRAEGQGHPRPRRRLAHLRRDEAALPAFSSMLEALAPGRGPSPCSRWAAPTRWWRWRYPTVPTSRSSGSGERGRAGRPELLTGALEAVPLPDGRGHAYLSAELRVTRLCRQPSSSGEARTRAALAEALLARAWRTPPTANHRRTEEPSQGQPR